MEISPLTRDRFPTLAQPFSSLFLLSGKTIIPLGCEQRAMRSCRRPGMAASLPLPGGDGDKKYLMLEQRSMRKSHSRLHKVRKEIDDGGEKYTTS